MKNFINKYFNQYEYYLLLLGIVFLMGRIIRQSDILMVFGFIIFLFLIFTDCFKIIKSKYNFIIKQHVFFLLFVILSLIWAQYPIVTILKLLQLLFLLVIIVTAAEIHDRNKKSFWDTLFYINVFFIVISLISLLIGYPLDSFTANHGKGFTGFFKHQNSLAAVLLFTYPGVIGINLKKEEFDSSADFSKEKKIQILNKRWILSILLFLLNLGILILTYSRSAILSFVILNFIFVFFSFNKKIITLAVVVVLLFIVLTNSFFFDLLKKGHEDIYSTRTLLWSTSISAAVDNFFLGVGFGNSSKDHIIPDNFSGSKYIFNRYFREKGNGILAMIEETGVIGFLAQCIPIFVLIFYLLRREVNFSSELILYISSIVSFVVHLQFESWITSFHITYKFIFLSLITYSISYFYNSKYITKHKAL